MTYETAVSYSAVATGRVYLNITHPCSWLTAVPSLSLTVSSPSFRSSIRHSPTQHVMAQLLRNFSYCSVLWQMLLGWPSLKHAAGLEWGEMVWQIWMYPRVLRLLLDDGVRHPFVPNVLWFRRPTRVFEMWSLSFWTLPCFWWYFISDINALLQT
jgi:hypothetical protein